MTKLEFLKELESLLPDIPLEEREEALQFYNGYFEDAGDENEEKVIQELGSPKRVAAIIKADLNSNDTDRESRGYFTENGYRDTAFEEEKYEVIRTTKTVANNKETCGQQNQTGSTDSDTNRKQDFGQSTGQEKKNKNYNRNTNIGLIILICILAIPVGLPLLFSALGVLIGVLGAIAGITIGFGAAGIAMILGGIILFVAGLIKITVPFVGLLLCGGGLVVFGIGMLFTLLCGIICKTLIPAIFRGIVYVCRLPFRNRSVMV